MLFHTKTINCPHCGQSQFIEIDASGGDQEYYDDCHICCNPIHLRLHVDDYRQKIELYVDSDNEQVY